MRIFTWHTHGRYLQSLSNLQHDIFVPVNSEKSSPYVGKGDTYNLPRNVYEVPVDFVRDLDLDCVIFQTEKQYEVEQYAVLNPDQRRLPRIFIEHDPPITHPTEAIHPVSDPEVLLVHVTHFNQLMWTSPGVESVVIDHGVQVPGNVRFSGEIPCGIAAVNNISTRGRRLGFDVLRAFQAAVPMHLVGMGTREIGGAGEVAPLELAAYEAHYRFFLNPMRWTSLSMAACEAMTIGMPVLGLATTEMATVIRNGIEGYVETSVDRLIAHARRLVADPDEAAELGANARLTALRRFSIERFVRDWDDVLCRVTGGRVSEEAVPARKVAS